MDEITSRENERIKKACALKQKKERQKQRKVLVEGWRLIVDAAAQGLSPVQCFITPQAATHERFQGLYALGKRLSWQFFVVAPKVYDKLKETQHPQGIAAVLPYFTTALDLTERIAPQRPIVYLQSVQDPGNLGSIIRTAAAADAGAVVLSRDSVDVYNDKVLRSAMGAVFKIPLVTDVDMETLQAYCLRTHRRLTGAAASGSSSYTQLDYAQARVLAFGNEGNGLTLPFLQACAETVTIPMRPETESLNLAAAVGIVLYKAWERQGFLYE